MTRLPPAAHRVYAVRPLTARPAAPGVVPVREESEEDRVGARALREAGHGTPGERPVDVAAVMNLLLAPAAGARSVLPATERHDAELVPAPAPPVSPAAAVPAQGVAETPLPAQAHEGTPLPVAPAQEAAPAAAPAEAAAPAAVVPEPASADEPPAPDAHRRIVARWRADVAAAGAAMQPPPVAPRADAAAGLAQTGSQARERQAQVREGLAADALATVPAAPEVDAPPAAPVGNPVPEHTQRILALSDRRLPDAHAPALEPSKRRPLPDPAEPGAEPAVGGNLPVVGDRPVAPDLFQVLTTPTALALAQIPTAGPEGSGRQGEADRLQAALVTLTRTPKPEDRAGRGPTVPTADRGPRPLPPLPPGLQAQRSGVGEVVARLLAQGERATDDAMNTLRSGAFPGGALGTEFPDIGARLRPELATMMDTELREIAAAAGFSGEQLRELEAQRRLELEQQAAAANADIFAQGQCIAEEVSRQAQHTSDAIHGAADQAAEETLRKQEAATGGTDPEVIHARRDRTVGWIREHVTAVTTHYQQAGERRTGELQRVRQDQGDAYRTLVQREQFQVLTPQPPARVARDLNNARREALLADIVNEIRVWGDQRVAAVDAAVGTQLAETARLTREHRASVEGAGSAGIEAARAWAEERELAGQSWWTRIVTRLRRWLSESRQLQEQWRVKRTAEHRDAVARDLALVEAARGRLQEGLTKDQILADRSLGEQERQILERYFAGREANPLDFAAQRLRDSVALAHMDRARPVFEEELVALPVRHEDYTVPKKLNAVLRAAGGDFDATRIAQQLHGAMDQIGTDEARIYSALSGLTRLQGVAVRKLYFAMYGSDLDKDLKSELSGDEEKRALAALQGDQARADAIALHDAIAGAGTDEAAIMATLRNKEPAQAQAIRDEYLRMYGKSLEDALKGDLEGNELDQANALLSGDTALADAIALDEAMRGGLTGWGTGEAEIEEVQKRVRAEVLAQAQSRNWTSAQMEAEVRRRLQAIEEKFEDKYKDVEQYNAPGVKGATVLQRAFDSELSGAQRDLANALQRNDLVAADAARIEIERTSFYSSDEKLREVLRSQYERALEARRLDEGPAQQMQVQRLVQELRERKPQVSEEEISRQRMALERKLEGQMEAGAQKDSEVSMEALRGAYERNYNRLSLAYDMERMTSGGDQSAARAMLKQGGRLTPVQEMHLAVAGPGTDEEALRRLFSRMTLREIDQLRVDWNLAYPKDPFDLVLLQELSGRDASDIFDMVDHGAPESALQQISAERRRVDRELNELTGVLGKSAAGSEAAWMQDQLKDLEKLEPDLKRTNWPEGEQGQLAREKLMGNVDFQVNRVREAVEDHRRRLDSYTDMATQVVGVAVGVVVAVVLGAVSGGTLGAVTIAVMASLLATTATMATKALIQGGAYGHEDMLVDAAVGVVDALASAATAGVGTKLLRPMKGLVARTRVGDLAGKLGSSSVARRIAQAPVVGGGLQRAGRAIGGRAGVERMAASFMAEGVEDAVSSMPSSLAQMAMTDDTWRGDPVMNFLEGGGMAVLQSVAMGRMMAGGMSVGTKAFHFGRGQVRMRSEVGRLLEANRLIQEGFEGYRQDNPGASVADFLGAEQGRSLTRQLKERRLLPTLERLAETHTAAAPRADTAAPAARTEAEAHAQRVAELTVGMPKALRAGTDVKPDASLEGNTVLVQPRRVDGRIVGVDVRAGPDATPLDIALHAATVHAMQQYRGVLGNIRRVLEDLAAVLTGSRLKVGSLGWEARLELGKLSAILATRMDGLSGSVVSPEVALHLKADVADLQFQVDQYQRVLADPELRGLPGRGYVAAKGKAKPKPKAKAKAKQKKPAQPRRPRLTRQGEQVQLEMALDDLRVARERVVAGEYDPGDPSNPVHKSLARIEELTGIPAEKVARFTDPETGMANEVRQLLDEIFVTLRPTKDPELRAQHAARLADAMQRVRALTGLKGKTIQRLARRPAFEQDLAILFGIDFSQPVPRAEAVEPPKAPSKRPPKEPKPPGPRITRALIAERVMRRDQVASFEDNLADPAWPARIALAAFVSRSKGALPDFATFRKSRVAEQLLGKGGPRDPVQEAQFEAAYRQACIVAERMRLTGRRLGMRVEIVESFFAVWARQPELGLDVLVRAMERWRHTAGDPRLRIFPASLVDAETRKLLGRVDRLLSDTMVPQFVYARERETGELEITVESTLLPGTLSRNPTGRARQAPSLNDAQRKLLKNFFKNTKLDPADWHMMHLIGPISGIEGGMGMVLGPKSINTGLQTHPLFTFDGKIYALEGIEPFMNKIAVGTRLAGGDVWVKSTLLTFPKSELRADIAAENVPMFHSVVYEIHIVRPGQEEKSFKVIIEVDPPPATRPVAWFDPPRPNI